MLLLGGLACLGMGGIRLAEDQTIAGPAYLVTGLVYAGAGLQVAWLHSPGERGVTRRMLDRGRALLVVVLVVSVGVTVVALIRSEWWSALVCAAVVGAVAAELWFIARERGRLEARP